MSKEYSENLKTKVEEIRNKYDVEIENIKAETKVIKENEVSSIEKEYETIKSHLLHKINRMESIEFEIEKIDEELKLRSQPNYNVTKS
jgi:F0F1-type ATP synthase membrane subunit b/b'